MPKLTGRCIVLAGCTGQVGKPVAKALAAQGNEVHGLARFKDPAAREEMEAAGVICHAVDLIDPVLSVCRPMSIICSISRSRRFD